MKPPPDLARLQRAFGQSIATPLSFVDDEGNYEIAYDRYDRVAVDAIAPHDGRSGAERLSVYNQQYWFRLLTIMQEEFPLTEALMGVQAFNRFSMGYLTSCPPDSVRLRDLSNRLADYAAMAEVDEVLADAIALERIYVESFDAASLPQPDANDEATALRLAAEPLRFQPHVALITVEHNVVELRRKLRRGEAVGRDDVERTATTWVLWRGRGIQAVDLGPLQARLLTRLMQGEALASACEALVEELEDDQVEFLVTHVQRWFAAWSQAGWFAQPADL